MKCFYNDYFQISKKWFINIVKIFLTGAPLAMKCYFIVEKVAFLPCMFGSGRSRTTKSSRI
jgi:hypothetical protein